MHFRILTYNIHKCVGGLDRRHDPDRVARAISHYQPDIALLQEVDYLLAGGAREKQVDLLGRRLGFHHLAYFPHVTKRSGTRYGNAVLSRFPITESHHIDLTVPLKKERGALHVRLRIRLPSGRTQTLHVYNLHLGLSGLERKWQLQRFLRSAPFARLHTRAPIVVGGDFNDVWGTLGEKILKPAGLHGAPRPFFTFPAFLPVRALDAIYLRGDIRLTHVQSGRSEAARFASDHLPLVADCLLTEHSPFLRWGRGP